MTLQQNDFETMLWSHLQRHLVGAPPHNLLDMPFEDFDALSATEDDAYTAAADRVVSQVAALERGEL